jgi:hypothetical protein
MAKHTPLPTINKILAECSVSTVEELSERYALKAATVRGILRRHGLTAKKPDPARFYISKERLEEVLQGGWMTLLDMAKTFDCSPSKVTSSMKYYGLQRGRRKYVRNRIRKSTGIIKVLAAILNNPEKPLNQIAQELMVTREYVSQIDAQARQEGIIK